MSPGRTGGAQPQPPPPLRSEMTFTGPPWSTALRERLKEGVEIRRTKGISMCQSQHRGMGPQMFVPARWISDLQQALGRKKRVLFDGRGPATRINSREMV